MSEVTGRAVSGDASAEGDPSLPARAFAAFAAGALAFAVATGGLLLLGGLFEGWAILAAFAAVPAAIAALMPPGGRIFCFAFGLIACAGTWSLDLGGGHNPLALLQWAALCLVLAAVLSEMCVRAARLLPWRSAAGL